MLCLENLKNLNTFPRKSSIFMTLHRKNMLDVTNLPSWVNNSEKRLWLGLVFLINIGKIIVETSTFPEQLKYTDVKWLKNGEKILDAGGAFGAVLTDLSKALDCLPHELLIAKLHAYEVDIPSLKLLHSYSTKRKQRVKLNATYRSWSEILFGIPQGSILGTLLLNIFLCDLFQFFPDADIVNYAGDNTPHSSNINLNKVL